MKVLENLNDLLLKTKAALLIVDVQNDYCHSDGALAKTGEDVSAVKKIVPNLQKLLLWARTYKKPVIFVQTIHDFATDSEVWKNRSSGRMKNVCRPGSWGAQFFEIAPNPGEIVVNKHKYSAFINTPLDSILRAHKIETLLVAGVCTNVCVESTARDGFMMDYRIVLLSDACASYSQQAHRMTLENISVYFGTVAKTSDIIGTSRSFKQKQPVLTQTL